MKKKNTQNVHTRTHTHTQIIRDGSEREMLIFGVEEKFHFFFATTKTRVSFANSKVSVDMDSDMFAGCCLIEEQF